MKKVIWLILVFSLVWCSQNEILDNSGNWVSSNKIKNINWVTESKSNWKDNIWVSKENSGINFKK